MRMPRKVTQVAGALVLFEAAGIPNCWNMWDPQQRSCWLIGEKWTQKLENVKVEQQVAHTPWQCSTQAIGSATAENNFGADRRPNGKARWTCSGLPRNCQQRLVVRVNGNNAIGISQIHLYQQRVQLGTSPIGLACICAHMAWHQQLALPNVQLLLLLQCMSIQRLDLQLKMSGEEKDYESQHGSCCKGWYRWRKLGGMIHVGTASVLQLEWR